MADNLSELFASMQASDAEIGAYRGRLRQAIASRRARTRRRILGTVAFATVAGLTLIATLGRTAAEPQTLSELEEMVASSTDVATLRDEAHDRAGWAGGIGGWNANMVLVLTDDESDDRITSATTGVTADPRPEFRARYLEVLLDAADDHLFDETAIERVMADETDELCLALLADLLRTVS